MKFQFTIRRMLSFVAFVSVLLSLLSLPTPLLVAGGAVFWLVLLAPLWVPGFFMSRKVNSLGDVRHWHGLIGPGAYCVIIYAGYFLPVSFLVFKGIVIAVTVAAALLILRLRAGWWCLLNAPHLFALACAVGHVVFRR